MNDYKNIVPFFKQWEGGLSNDMNDSASKKMCPTPLKGKYYHTNKGVTYETWVEFFGAYKNLRFLEMNDADWGVIFKAGYWDRVKGDLVPGQSIAEVMVSWAWGSGAGTAIKQMQRLLNQIAGYKKGEAGYLEQDGVLGKHTLGELDKYPEQLLFDKACEARESFFRYISNESNGKTPAQRSAFKKNQKNLKGWLNRLEQFKKKFRPA